MYHVSVLTDLELTCVCMQYLQITDVPLQFDVLKFMAFELSLIMNIMWNVEKT